MSGKSWNARSSGPAAACPAPRRSSAAARGSRSSGPLIPLRLLGRCAVGGSIEALQRLVFPQQLDALEEARRDLGARDCDADRFERLARRQLKPLREPPKRRFDLRRRERVDPLELVT